MDTDIKQEAIDKLLTDLKVHMDGDHKSLFVEYMNEQLQKRINEAIVDLLSREELVEFITVAESGDRAKIIDWLDYNLGDYKDFVDDEVGILFGDVAHNKDSIASD